MLLYQFGRYSEAHGNLDRAASIFHSLSDEGSLAQVNETRARVLVAEQRYREANRVLSEVIPVFEKSGEYALLADAFNIQGIVWARLKAYDSSMHILRRAMSIAHDSGALSNAGLAALTLIEEHGSTRLPEGDLAAIYRRADEWLKDTQDAEEIARLRACARIVTRRLSVSHAKLSDEDFSLPDAVLAYEGRFIEQALELENGILTRAAKRLGISRQWLAYLLKTRHRTLRRKRTPADRQSERSPSSVREPRQKARSPVNRKAQPLSILIIEDDSTVGDALKETLEAEGWRVRLCADAVTGRGEIEGGAHYDLMILDHQLGGDVSGVELVRYARSLAHRRETPIVMFSGSYVEGEAKEAGADAFLRKPQDIGSLTAVVSRLLSKGNRETGGAEG